MEFPGGLGERIQALPLLWHGYLLWPRLDPWPGNFHTLQVWPKKKVLVYIDLNFKKEAGHLWTENYATKLSSSSKK